MCIYTNIYIHTHTHIYVYIYTYIYKHIYEHVSICKSICVPPNNAEIALQTPRIEFWRYVWYCYSTNDPPKMNLLTLLVEIS